MKPCLLKLPALASFAFTLAFAVAPEPARAAASPGQSVRAILSAGELDPGFLEDMEKHGFKLMEAKNEPRVGRAGEALARIIESILLPKDGARAFEVMLVDSAFPNMAVAFEPGTAKRARILVSMGMMEAAENDDQLKYVLGHELEHLTSEIDAHVLDMKKKLGGWIGFGDQILLDRLTAARENEVDLKSVYYRVHQTGGNPAEGMELLEKIGNEWGSKGGDSHTTDLSRRNTMSMGVTAFSRDLGEEVNSGPSRTEVTSILKPYLESAEWKRYQQEQISRILREPVSEAKPIFEAIRDGRASQLDPASYSNFHARVFAERWKHLKRYAPSSHTQLAAHADLQLRLHASIRSSVEAFSARILGRGFKPRNVHELAAAAEMNRLVVSSALEPYGYHPGWVAELDMNDNLKQALARTRAELASARGERAKLLEAEEAWTLRKIKLHERRIKAFEELHSLPGASATMQTYRREFAKLSYGDIPPRILELKNELVTYQKHIGPAARKAATRLRLLYSNGLPLILDDLARSSENADSALTALNALPEAGQGPAVRAILPRFVSGHAKDLASASTRQERIRVLDRGMDFLSQLGSSAEFDAAFAAKDHALLQAMRDFLKANAGAVETPEDFENYLRMKFSSRYRPLVIHSKPVAGGLALHPELAEALLTGDVADVYLSKLLAASASRLGTPAMVRKPGELLDHVENALAEAAEFARLTGSDPASRGYVEGIDRMRTEAQARLTTALRRSRYPQDPARAADALYRLRFPVAGSPPDAATLEIAKSVARHAPSAELLSGTLSFDSLTRNALPAVRKKTRFFELVHELGPLVGQQGARGALTSRQLEGLLGNRLDYVEWVRRYKPADFSRAAAVLLNDFEDTAVYKRAGEFLNRRLAALADRRFGDLLAGSVRGSAPERFFELGRAFAEESTHLRVSKDQVARLAPSDPRARLAFTKGFQSELVRWAKSQGEYAERAMGVVEAYQEALLGDLKGPSRFLAYDVDSLAELVTSPELDFGRSPAFDELFEWVWMNADRSTALRRKLLDERLVGKLYFDDTKLRFAKWQLNQRFGLIDAAGRRRLLPKGPRSQQAIRPVVRSLSATIGRQFPKNSALKDALIEEVEDAVRTNPAESRLLSEGRISLKNWYKASELALVDVPTGVSNALHDNLNRMQYLEYLTGKRKSAPQVNQEMVRGFGAKDAGEAEDTLKALKRAFSESSVHARNFMLQSLLDHEEGLLRDPVYTDRVYRMVLGENYDEPVFREVFMAYLESAPKAERKVLLGHMLASSVGTSSAKRSAASLSDILSAMGPLGIKAGQFIRANGLASPKLLAELDSFFDAAIPPSRPKILADIDRIFGDKASRVQVNDLIGSGSLNYTVQVDLLDEKGRKLRTALVRIQRDSAEGRIRNEARIWTDAIGRLKASANPDVKQVGLVVDEAFQATMTTLGPGGMELDMSYERGVAPKAALAYERPAGATGFSIEVARPIAGADDWIPKELRKSAELYDFVGATPLARIKDPGLRKALAKQIVEAELDALFTHGVFDPDGHPGNWLVDTRNKRLVRIDYSQLQTDLDRGDIEATRKMLGALMDRRPDTGQLDTIARGFERVFSVSAGVGEKDLRLAIERAAGSAEYRRAESGLQRLLALRDGTDRFLKAGGVQARVRLGSTARSVVGSLSRIQGFSATMGEVEFARTVLKRLDVPFERVAVQFAQDRAKKFVKRIVSEAIADTRSVIRCVMGALAE